MLSGFRAGVERGRGAADPTSPAPTDDRDQLISETKDVPDVTTLSTEAANFSWLLGNFVKSVPGVQHTLVVSADGLLMADVRRAGPHRRATSWRRSSRACPA